MTAVNQWESSFNTHDGCQPIVVPHSERCSFFRTCAKSCLIPNYSPRPPCHYTSRGPPLPCSFFRTCAKLCLIQNYPPWDPHHPHYPQSYALFQTTIHVAPLTIPHVAPSLPPKVVSHSTGAPTTPPPARHVGPPLSPKLCLIPNSVPFSGQLNLELVRTFWPLTNTNKN